MYICNYLIYDISSTYCVGLEWSHINLSLGHYIVC